MTKNRNNSFTRAMVRAPSLAREFSAGIATLFLGASIAMAAEQAAVVAKEPLKTTPILIGGTVVRELEPGNLVTVLKKKGSFSQVALADDPSIKGWIKNASISKDKDIIGGLANMKSADTAASDTKGRIASSLGGAAKGLTDLSPAAEAAAASGKGKAASFKEDVGAAVKGKQKAGQEALEDAVGADAEDVMSAATDTAAKFKGKSASTLEKIEALKISETEISGFMKEGGLRSRLIR
ncbi:MAG: hypothetical protein J0L82_00415 [Deltaproteobacteria bacterium]|nr:hypothetical protein [Deltaproteobacteria bacterium]